MEYYSVLKKNEVRTRPIERDLENVTPSGRSQCPGPQCMVPSTWKVQGRSIHRDGKQRSGCRVCVGLERAQGVTARGCKVSLEGDENVPKLNYGDGRTIL